MNTTPSDNKALFAKWALALFIIGILGAILIAAFSPLKVLAGVFLWVSMLLALILGIIGWRHTAGKIAVCGVLVLLVASLAGALYYYFLEIPPKSQIYRDEFGSHTNSPSAPSPK